MGKGHPLQPGTRSGQRKREHGPAILPEDLLSADRLLDLPADRRATELRRVREREDAALAHEHRKHRVMWQCVALAFSGVPVYAVGWGLADPRLARVAVTFGFFVSYAAPFFRWLIYHVRQSDEFGR